MSGRGRIGRLVAQRGIDKPAPVPISYDAMLHHSFGRILMLASVYLRQYTQFIVLAIVITYLSTIIFPP